MTATAGPTDRVHVLVVTGEPLKEQLAGPAIRAWEMARLLSAQADVTLATLSPVCQRSHPGFRTTSATDAQLRRLEQWCDVVVFQGSLLEYHPWFVHSEKVLVADVYDPYHLEVLEQLRDGDEGCAPERSSTTAGPSTPSCSGPTWCSAPRTSSATSG